MGKPQKRNEELQAIAVSLWRQLGSGNAVAKRLGLSPPTVYRMLHDAGVDVPDRHSEAVQQKKRKLSGEAEAEAVRAYADGESLNSITSRLGVGAYAVVSAVKRLGAARRPHGGKRRQLSAAQDAKILELRDLGLSQAAIAASVGCGQAVVSRRLRAAGVETKWPKGSGHHAWRGGVVKAPDGYVSEMVSPDSPLAPMRNAQGYVLQHRLKVAEALGRCLSKNETVHHINGDKTDNRIENLQLRMGRHGRGASFCCAKCGSVDIVAVKIKD